MSTDKDHKKEETVQMRPIVNAMVGAKKTLSEMFSEVLENVLEVEEDDTICRSTEELICTFEKYNNEKRTQLMLNVERIR